MLVFKFKFFFLIFFLCRGSVCSECQNLFITIFCYKTSCLIFLLHFFQVWQNTLEQHRQESLLTPTLWKYINCVPSSFIRGVESFILMTQGGGLPIDESWVILVPTARPLFAKTPPPPFPLNFSGQLSANFDGSQPDLSMLDLSQPDLSMLLFRIWLSCISRDLACHLDL